MSALIMHIPIPNKPASKHHLTFNRSSKALHGVVSSSGRRSCIFRCNAQSSTQTLTPTLRRSGNYKPPVWDSDFIESLSSEYTEERHLVRAGELVEQVKMLLDDEQVEVVRQLELIDDLQRLGISYHFQQKINQILNSIYFENYKNFETTKERDLYSTALGFRLLRQHGFEVPQEVFDCFKNEGGDFKASLAENTRGLLQLYEASFLLTKGEKTLELAREFSTSFLHKKLDNDKEEEYVRLLIRQALELPIHWSSQRPHSRWFVHVYEKRISNMNPTVLELAKLDFNIVQAKHQQELKHVYRWWKETCLAEKLPFARDRLVECYLWALGEFFDPQYGYSRIMATKMNILITIMDDIFDIYGTLEELMLFNDTIQRWDIEAVDQLPYYMQICFLAVNNLVNEMAYDVLKGQGILIIPHLRKPWADLCTTYIQEAKWYSTGYVPTMDEYLQNAWISVGAHVMLSLMFFLLTNPIEDKAIESFFKYHNIVRCSSMLVRLANDPGTSPYEMERGDVPKLIECYMNERGGSSEEAREYVKLMIWETWKEMNEERVATDSPLSKTFITSAADLGRIAQYIYQHGDGHGIQNPQIKDRISTLLFHPIL